MKRLLGICLVLCLGCSARKDVVIVLGLGIEKQGHTYLVHAEIGQSERVKQEQYLNYVMGEGKSLEEAFAKAQERVGSRFYYSHVQLIALNKEMSEDLGSLRDYLSSFKELPLSCFVVLSKNPKELLSNNKVHQAVKLSSIMEYRNVDTGLQTQALEQLWQAERPILLSQVESVEEELQFEDSLYLLFEKEQYELNEREAFVLSSLMNWIDRGSYRGNELVQFSQIKTYEENNAVYVLLKSDAELSKDIVEEIQQAFEEGKKWYLLITGSSEVEVSVQIERNEK